MHAVISAYLSLARLPSRTQPPMRSSGSKKLKYIDSLKFEADSSGCMYSSDVSRRSFMGVISLGLARVVKQVLRSAVPRLAAASPTVAAEPELATGPTRFDPGGLHGRADH